MNIIARVKAQRFNIWTEQIDKKRKSDGIHGYFIYNKTIYYGNRFLVFFKSYQNKLFKHETDSSAVA